MHRSRLAGFIIDCQDTDPQVAATFWSAALAMPKAGVEPGYVGLDAGPRDLSIEVQDVTHPSRVHLDIAADDIEAEVERLESLGARRVGPCKRWFVMEAPTGQRFCVIQGRDLENAAGVTVWERGADGRWAARG